MLNQWSKVIFSIWLILFSLGHLPTFAMNPIMLVVIATIYFILVIMGAIEKKKD